MNTFITTFPLGSCAVKVIHSELAGTWEFGVAFRHGRGRLFNTYTRYYLRPIPGRQGTNFWEGWPKGAPDPMNPADHRRVYDWIEQTTRPRRWLQRKIEQHAQQENTDHATQEDDPLQM